MFVLDRDIDPRHATRPSSFASRVDIERRAAELGARAVVARLTPTTTTLGTPIATRPPWALWSLPADPSTPSTPSTP
jgi:hypothetical protein